MPASNNLGQTIKGAWISQRVDDEGSTLIGSVQAVFRDSFPGTAGLDPNKWQVMQLGTGMTISTNNGTMTIASGTTINQETILMSRDAFMMPVRLMIGMSMSQKIINQDCVMELVSVDPLTGQPNNKDAAAWRTHGPGGGNATAGAAFYEVQSSGMARLTSGAVNAIGLTGDAIREISLFPDECWFEDRGMDSVSARSNTYLRHQQIPDPAAVFKIRIRVANLGTAPASNTNFNFRFVSVTDHTELQAEITGGRGNVGSGQAVPVQVLNTPSVNANLVQNGLLYTDSVSNLTAGATFTGSTRDPGSNLHYTGLRINVAHTAGNGHGHLVVQQSTDGTTWRESHRWPVPSDGAYRTFFADQVLRYMRLLFVNGTTAQTQMFLASAYMRTDPPNQNVPVLHFGHTIPAMAASTTYFGPTLDLGGNSRYHMHRMSGYSDQAGQLVLEESPDGSTWLWVSSMGVSAGASNTLEGRITNRYVRARYTNGATPNTIIRVYSTLIPVD